MTERCLLCPHCKAELFEQFAHTPPPQHCPGCDRELRMVVFPGWHRARNPVQSSPSAAEDQASCFFHPNKQAALACDDCGRFICTLCDLEIGGKHLCPTCLNKGSSKGRITDLERQRTRYDQIVWSLFVLGLLFFFFAAVPAAIALFIVFWKWNAPISRVTNTKRSMGIAVPFLVLELVGCVIFWANVVLNS